MLATPGSHQNCPTYIGGHLWTPHNPTKIEHCTITCEDVQFREQRQVVELETKYIALSMNRDFKYSN
jgi:hypothetical protein